MKTRFFWILSALLLWAVASRGAVITATVTVTNLPTSGATFIVNGNTRTWTNTASMPAASWILIGDWIGGSATNLYNHVAANPYSSPFLILGRSSTNGITLRSSGALSVTTNEWMTVSYSTNVGTNVYAVAVPPGNVPGETNRTNNAHWLVDYLNDYVRTNALKTNAVVASNYLSKGASPQQYVASPVQFNGMLRAGAEVNLTNGFTKAVTNINQVSSNAINFGNSFRSDGDGGVSLQLGSNALARSTRSISIGANSLATNADSIAFGSSAVASNQYSTAIGNASIAQGQYSTAIGQGAYAFDSGGTALGQGVQSTGVASIGIGVQVESSGPYSISIGNADTGATKTDSIAIGAGTIATGGRDVAIGSLASSTHSNSVAIGASATTTDTNQIRLGTSSEKVSIPGILLISGTQSNTTFSGMNIAGGAWSFPRADLSSIANGNNISIPLGTNQFVRLSGSVSAAPTLCGFIGGATSGGTDGQWVTVHNDLGYALTVAQNTVDPVAANRVETGDGNDATVINNGWFDLRYSTSDSRWHLENIYPVVISASATNAMSSVQTNEAAPAFIGTLLTNLLFSTGVTGYLSGATAILGVSIPPGTSTNALVSTNGTTVSAAAGTFDFVSGITGYVSGAKVLLGVDQGALLGAKVDELNGVSTNLANWGTTTNGNKLGIADHLYIQGGYYVGGKTTNANEAYFGSNIWQTLSGGSTARLDVLRVSGDTIFSNEVQMLTSATLRAAGGVGANFIDVTNDFRSRSNSYFFGTNDFYKTVRFVNVATNKLLFNDANTNVVGLGLGANLSISGGNLVASGSGGGGDFNVNQFATVGTVTNIKDGALLTNLFIYGYTNTGSGSNSGRFDIGGALTVVGATTLKTNMTGDGTNILRYIKISGGVPAGKILRTDGSTNVVDALISGSLTFDGTTLTGSGGTNYPPVIGIATTNIAVGSGVRQSIFIKTNSTFGFNFQGTPLNGEEISLSISNYSSSTIYATSYVGGTITGVYDPTVASNVTAFAISGTSQRFFEFVSSTNANLGTARWELRNTLGKQLELAVGGETRLSTNGGTVTAYQAYTTDWIDAGFMRTNATNVAATYQLDTQYQVAAPSGAWLFSTNYTNELWFTVGAPAAWDGTPIKCKFLWHSTNSTASQTNVWEIAAGRWVDYTNTVTLGTAQIVRAARGSSQEISWSSATPALTIAATPAAELPVAFRIRRLPAHADDTALFNTMLFAVGVQWGLTNAVVTSW